MLPKFMIEGCLRKIQQKKSFCSSPITNTCSWLTLYLYLVVSFESNESTIVLIEIRVFGNKNIHPKNDSNTYSPSYPHTAWLPCHFVKNTRRPSFSTDWLNKHALVANVIATKTSINSHILAGTLAAVLFISKWSSRSKGGCSGITSHRVDVCKLTAENMIYCAGIVTCFLTT